MSQTCLVIPLRRSIHRAPERQSSQDGETLQRDLIDSGLAVEEGRSAGSDPIRVPGESDRAIGRSTAGNPCARP